MTAEPGPVLLPIEGAVRDQIEATNRFLRLILSLNDGQFRTPTDLAALQAETRGAGSDLAKKTEALRYATALFHRERVK